MLNVWSSAIAKIVTAVISTMPGDERCHSILDGCECERMVAAHVGNNSGSLLRTYARAFPA